MDAYDQIRAQQQAFILNQIPSIVIINGLVAGLIAIDQAQNALTPRFLLWLGVFAALAAVQLRAWLKLRNRPLPSRASGRLLNASDLVSFAYGCNWGASVFVVPMHHLNGHNYFPEMAVIGMAAGTFCLLSPTPRVVWAFVFPSLSLLLLHNLIMGNLAELELSVMMILLVLAMIRGASANARFFEDLIRSAATVDSVRNHLSNALQASSDAIGIFDRKGTLVTANERFRTNFAETDQAAPKAANAEFFDPKTGTWWLGASNRISDGGTIVIYADITQLKTAQKATEQALLKAEEASKAKSGFIANISHELRTPLNAIIGFSDLLTTLKPGSVVTPNHADYARTISKSGNALLAVVNSMIDLTRFDSTKYELQPGYVRMDLLIGEAIDLAQRAVGDNRPVDVAIERDAQTFFLDRPAVLTALYNIINNALKYTSPTARIVVSAYCSNGAPHLSVTDTGAGISPDRLAGILQPFGNTDFSPDQDHHGIRLGLAISKLVMDRHDGKLLVRSTPGNGTSIILQFARTEPAAYVAPIPIAAVS